MNLVYNSAHYSILAFPAQELFELVDKIGVRALLVRGSRARELREAIDSIPIEERNEETIDALLDDCCAGAAEPIRFH